MNLSCRIASICLLSLAAFSCSTSKMALEIPEQISGMAQKIKVAGVRGSGFPGTYRKLKFEEEFNGRFKNGWRVESSVFDQAPGGMFSEEAFKRSLLSNYGLNINEVSSKEVDKYQFKVANKEESVLVLCKQSTISNSTDYRNRRNQSISVLNEERSDFTAFISSVRDTANKRWQLIMQNKRENPDGSLFGMIQQGIPKEYGTLSNGSDTIHVSPIFLKTGNNNARDPKMPFEIVGGYEFRKGEMVVGVVDIFNTSVWLFPSTIAEERIIIVSAATALLLRNR